MVNVQSYKYTNQFQKTIMISNQITTPYRHKLATNLSYINFPLPTFSLLVVIDNLSIVSGQEVV